MPSYGFRLFEVELRERNGRKPVEIDDVAGEHLAVVVAHLLNERLNNKIVGLPARVADEEADLNDEPHLNKPAMLVRDVQRIGKTVRWRTQYGRYSDFDLGLGLPGSPDADLKDVAPSRPFRAVLNLPPTGTKGVLAVEDISRSCPVQMLVRWLKQASMEEAAERARSAAEATGASADDTVAAVAGAKWWRLSVKPMADEEHLSRLIREGRLERVELIRRGYGRGNTPDSREMELTVRGLTQQKARRAGELVTAWFKSARREVDDDNVGPRTTDAEAAKALAAVLGKEIEALGFDDGYVVVEEGGKGKHISPSRLSDYFIYQITRDRQPSDLGFYDAVAAQHKRLAKATQTTGVEWPSIL